MKVIKRKIGDLIIGPNDVKLKIVSDPFLTEKEAKHVLETSMIFNRKYGYLLLKEDQYWYIVEQDVLNYNKDNPQYINDKYIIKSIPFYSKESADLVFEKLQKDGKLGSNSLVVSFNGIWYIVEAKTRTSIKHSEER